MKAAYLLPLLLLPALGRAQGRDEKRVHLIYDHGYDFSLNMTLIEPFEKAVASEAARIRIRGITDGRAYYSNGNVLFDLPEGLDRKSLAGLGAASETRQAAVLERSKDLVFVEARDAGLLDKLLEAAEDQGDEAAYTPGAVKEKGRLETRRLAGGGTLSALHVESREPKGPWRGTMAVSYDLLVDGRPVRVLMAGKPLGGPQRTRALEGRRVAELKEPVVRFSLGELELSRQFDVARGVLLDTLKREGYRFLAFSDWDMEFLGQKLIDYARSPASGVPLLCSNLKLGPGAPAIENVHVEEAEGVKIGFLSLVPLRAGELAARKGLPFEVRDPVEAAREAVRELRARRGVDLVVAASQLDSEEDLKVLQNVWGIDVYLESRDPNVKARRRVRLDLEHWSAEEHGRPVLRAVQPYHSYNEIALAFHPAERGFELERVEELPGPTDPDEDSGDEGELTERLMNRFLGPKQPLLPDPRELWPGEHPLRLNYAPEQFWSLTAQLVRRRMGTELAVLRVGPMHSNMGGRTMESYVSEWLLPDRSLATLRLKGRDLKSLLRRAVSPLPPFPGDRNFDSQTWLAAAGLDEKGRIGAVPLADNEWYGVATTEELLQKTEEFPELKQAADLRKTGQSLTDLVMGELKQGGARIGEAGYNAELKSFLEGRTPKAPVWRLNLRRLSLEFDDAQVQGSGALSQVRDARIQAQSQVAVLGALRLFSEVYWDKLRWNSGVSADYGQVTVHPTGSPSVTNVTQDNVVLETELNHRSLYLPKSGLTLGPFVNLSYSTQFARPPNTPRAQIVLAKAGAELFDGVRLKEFYLGGALQTDYSFPSPSTQAGLAAGLAWDSQIPMSPISLKAEASYTQFLPSGGDNAADLRRKLDVNVRFSSPLLGQLRLSPFFDYYLFEGAKAPGLGYNFLFGVSLDYSKLWKPFF